MTSPYRAAVARWQQHLRDGGTTPWASFEAGGAPAAADGPTPSAVHLELVRRLDSSLPDFAGLADLVLATPAPGRGSVDIPVAGAGAPTHGAPPVDPSELPASELIRLAVGVLDGFVTGATVEDRSRSWGRRFAVAGAPVSAVLTRRAGRAAGWRERAPGRAPTYVFLPPLHDGMMQVWQHRVRLGGVMAWPTLWRRVASADVLPGSLSAETQLARAGRRAVPIQGTCAQATQTMQGEHGLSLGAPQDLVATELTRRLNPVLAVRLSAPARLAASDQIERLVGRSTQPVTTVAVPRQQRGWLRSQAGESDYAADSPTTIPDDRVLSLALAAVGRGWKGVR